MAAYQRVTPDEKSDIAALRSRGLSISEIAREIGRSTSSVHLALTKEADPYGGAPSPETIRERCREVRTEWSEKELSKRAVAPAPWLPPLVVVAELADFYAAE